MSIRRPGLVTVLLLVVVGVTLATSCAADPPAASAGTGGDDASWPWSHQPDGAPSVHEVAAEPSLEFPPGTTYGEALTALFVAARSGGLPEQAVPAPPLPAEAAYAEPTAGRGLRLSLTAPWGWAPDTGAIRAPSVGLPSSLSPEQAEQAVRDAHAAGAPLPEGAWVDAPVLPACQVVPARGERPPCG